MKSAAMTATLIVLLLTTGCAAVGETASAGKAMVDGKSAAETITMAKAKYAEARKKGCAWRDTRKMIKSAEKLASEGNEENAQAVASRAMRQAELGLQQCDLEDARYKS